MAHSNVVIKTIWEDGEERVMVIAMSDDKLRNYLNAGSDEKTWDFKVLSDLDRTWKDRETNEIAIIRGVVIRPRIICEFIRYEI